MDPINRRLEIQHRKEAAPDGYVSRRTLCERVGLTDTQFRALAKMNVISSDGANSHGYVLYKLSTVQRLVTMKADGSLFRQLPSSATADGSTLNASVPIPTLHYSAEDGVRVFELLDEGKTLKDIILTTRIHPLLVKAIVVDHDDLIGSIHLPRDVVDQINGFGNVGKLPGGFPVHDANDVLAVVQLCTVDRTCTTCTANAALSSCEECLVKERRAALAMSRSA